MALKKSPEMQSKGKKHQRTTTKMRGSKAESSSSPLSPHHVFADSNAIKIGILGAGKKRYQRVANRKRPNSMPEIEIASTALKKMKAEVKKKKKEMSLMKNNLAETRATVEEMESMLYQLKEGVYAMKNWMQITTSP